jgi:hypothetical protein
MRSMRLMSILAMLVLVVLAAAPGVSRAGCACLPGGTTQLYWGSGANCSQATSAAAVQGYDEADASCYPDSVCLQTFVVDTACYWDAAAMVYKVSGRVRYRCEICS